MVDSKRAPSPNYSQIILESQAAAPEVTVTKPRFSTPDQIAKHERNVRRLEEADKRSSQPLEYSPDQHIDRPRCSLTIASAPKLSLSSEEYIIHSTITHHPCPDGTSKPIVLNTSNTALATSSPQKHFYQMYTSPTLEYESRVPYQQNNIPLLRKTKDYNTKFPITAEKGFFELPPGGKHTADLRLEIAEWRRFLEAGKTYYMLYTGERRPRWGGKVRYWRYGTFESLKGEMCDYDEDKLEDGIVLPRSNIIELMVVE